MGLPSETPEPELTYEQVMELLVLEQDRLFRWCFRLTGNEHDAADLVIETDIAVAQKWKTYHPERGSFGPWVRTVAFHLFISAKRRKTIATLPLMDNADAGSGAPLFARGSQVVDVLIQRENEERLTNELARLDGHYRVVAELYLQGLDFAEIAAVLGTPVGTVYSRMDKIRKRVGRALQMQDKGDLV
jgi:RNA polymerase sigma-70 factor (ECF subfamily)